MDIADECDVDRRTICRWTKNFNLRKGRGRGRNINHIRLYSEVIEFLNGELLGDGCLSKIKNKDKITSAR